MKVSHCSLKQGTWGGGIQGVTSLSAFVLGSWLTFLVVAEVTLGHPKPTNSHYKGN